MNYFSASKEVARKMSDNFGVECVITNSIEKNYGWVFFYDTKTSHKAGAEDFGLLGNTPIFVSKEGEFIFLPPMCSETLFFKNWEAANGQYKSAIDLTFEEEQYLSRVVNSVLKRVIQSKASEVWIKPVNSSDFHIYSKLGGRWKEIDHLFLYALVSWRLQLIARMNESEGELIGKTGYISVETPQGSTFTISVKTEQTKLGKQLFLSVK